MSVSEARAAISPKAIDPATTARLNRLFADLSSGDAGTIFAAIRENYDVSPILYSSTKEKFVKLSTEFKQLEDSLKNIRSRVAALQTENETITCSAKKDEIQQIGLEREILTLDAEQKKADLDWKDSCKAIQVQHPGGKPQGKAAVQRWKKNMETFNKIAPGLRVKESKAKQHLEQTDKELHEKTCKIDCLQKSVLDSHTKIKINKGLIQLLQGEISRLEENLKSVLKDIERCPKKLMRRIRTQGGKELLKNELSLLFKQTQGLVDCS